jgi:hypothetical protein
MLIGILRKDLYVAYNVTSGTTESYALGPFVDIMNFLAEELNFTNTFSICLNDLCTVHTYHPQEIYNAMNTLSMQTITTFEIIHEKSSFVPINIESE